MNLFKTIAEQRRHDDELRERDYEKFVEKHMIKVCLKLEFPKSPSEYPWHILKAVREDGFEHTISFRYGSKFLRTYRLKLARRLLINEIELITGKGVFIVIDFDKNEIQ